MLISFFEEFPSGKNLTRLQYFSKSTKLYLAAESILEFKKIVSRIKSKSVKEYIYWPILKRHEGYWISPFSERKALVRIFQELEREKIPVMLDLELPTTQNPWLYLTQFPTFWSNKRLIRKFISKYKGEIYLAEYYPEGYYKEKLLEWLGLHYAHPKVKVIKMLYASLHRFNLVEKLHQGKQEYGNKFIVGLGTIAPGIHADETVLTPTQLEQDLQTAKKTGIREVIVFRLGGLNETYVNVLKNFAQ